MKLKAVKCLTITLFVALAALLFACKPETTLKKSNYDVRVVLRECEGMTILSSGIKDTTAGKSVEFDIEIDDDYIYVGNTAQATYDVDTGKLRLEKVLYPTTIDIILTKKPAAPTMYQLKIMINQSNCTVNTDSDSDWYEKGSEISVTAESGNGCMFLGWSSGGFISDGGKLISTETNYSFQIKYNINLYANFTSQTEYTIIYHTNGGKVANTGKDTYQYIGEYKEVFPMQQTLESNGTFVRDGYVAVGYSTTPAKFEEYSSVNDIPGFSNMGGVCKVGESGILNLYVVWAKCTDTSKFTYGNGTITGFRGTDKIIVIPEKINGNEVTRIQEGVFSGDITRVVIPKTILTVDNYAFEGCTSLSEVVFFDTMLSITDSSFINCNNISTICMNAGRLPKYSGHYEGSYCIKYERLRTLTTKKLIVVSGSSTLYGLDSIKMEENFPGYSVINYGTNAANQSVFFLEVISNYVIKGDIIIHSPEFSSGGPMGGNVIAPKMFRASDQCYDIFREVDMRNYSGFFTAYYKFTNGDGDLEPAINREGKPYQDINTSMNLYGDILGTRSEPTFSLGYPTNQFNFNLLNGTNLNRVNKLITQKGGTLLMSFGTYDFARMVCARDDSGRQVLRKSDMSEENAEYFKIVCDMFTNDCQDKLDYPVISNIGTYIMDHAYFSNSEWHCTNAGTYNGVALRTQNLTNDLRAYLATIN